MSRKEEVRDGFFGDLPAYLQSQLMEIHKIIVDNCNSTFKENNYSSINKTPWAKQMLAEFLTAPKDKYYVGGVRVYKYGKRYRCMIQITGHVTNNRNSIDEELFHDFIRNVHQDIRAMIKRKYDLHLTCESVHGEHFEGFDVWTSKKVAEQIWKSFDDKKTKKIDEYNEGFVDTEYTFANILEMPKMLVEDVADYYKLTESTAEGFGCYLELYRNNDTYEGRIYVDDSKHWLAESVVDKYEESHPCIKVYSNNTLTLEAAYAEKLFNELESVNEDVHYSWITQEESENLYEASHSKLKYAFRMGYDANTGHQIKVVYSLDGAEITNVGNFYSDRHLNGRTREDSKKDHLDYVKNNISKDGNGDFESKGQKVLAIIDVVDKRRLDEVDLINPLTSGIDKTALSQSKENLTKAKNIIKILPKHCVHLKVGEIDNTPSYKSTFWAIGLKGDESRWRNIENIENLKNVRGWKGNNVFTKRGDEEGINYNQLVTKNPTKAQALKELKARKDMVGVQLSNLEKHAANNESDAGYKSLKHDYEVIQNDIKTIQDGEYNPRIMDKYHSKMLEFAYPVDDCGLSVEQLELFFGLYEGVVNWDYGIDDYINEGADQNYLTDNEAKRTLAAVSKNIINDSKKQISQYTANIYANVITKNLLDKWAPGYKKFSIILDNFKADNVIEFKTPTMDQSFISRFIDGKETMNGFLHRNPEIKIKMSPKIFEGMKDKDDAYKFFRAAIRYYAEGAEKYAEKLCKEFHKMNNEMKKLVQNTKLSGIVSLPLQMLFTFSNVSIDDVYTFTISQEDINAVNTFVRGIYTNYASPEKEKKEILDGLRKVIDSFNESTTDMEFNYLPSELEKLYEGTYNTSLSRYKEQFISENVDITWNNHINPEIRLLQEKTHMKKLKKIPADLVAYISIEAECIKDANDKMMIASYCISKLEIVEWYIELLETSSKKYLVPHSLPYLQTLRTQLLACYKKIMDVKIVNPNDRPIIDIKYPDELKR